MQILDYFEQNRNKVLPLKNIIDKVKREEITFEEFKVKTSKFIKSLTGVFIPIKIIDDNYPQIFVNCDIQNLRFVVHGLFISTSLINEFPTDELIAAILHEVGHYIRIKKNPKLAGWFYKSRIMGYIYTGAFALLTKGLLVLRSNKIQIKHKKYLLYLLYLLYISSVLLLLTSAYFYHKVGIEEHIADSFATKYGYGRELVSFIKQYKEIEEMYGYSKLSKVAEFLSSLVRKFMQLIKLHPSDDKRICEIMYQIINNTDRNKKFDSNLYDWAKQQYQQHCIRHKPVEDADINKLDKLLDVINKKLKR